MDVYEVSSQFEEQLRTKADQANIPLGGSIELTPLCNMNCRMCYVHMSREQMERSGRMLTCDEWLRIATEAKEKGVLYLLLTGGEPLLFPEFKQLYTRLMELGFVVTLNSNGTLINEEWADFFAAHPCRRINITLYGKNNEVYQNLCGNPNGFSQVMRAADLLRERNVPFRLHTSITPENVEDIDELYRIAGERDIYLRGATYMFPAVRLGKDSQTQEHLDPESAARAMYLVHQRMRTEEEMRRANTSTLASLHLPPRFWQVSGFSCHAGHSGFWMNWKGEIQACGMMNGPSFSLLEYSFVDCWQKVLAASAKVDYCEDCRQCELQNICQICPAMLMAETGAYHKRPDYICRYTRELFRLMMADVSPEERELHTKFLEGLKTHKAFY